MYMNTYSKLLNPINGMYMQLRTPLPPIIKRQLGRPKTKMVREVDEVQNLYKLLKKNLVMTCKICNENIQECATRFRRKAIIGIMTRVVRPKVKAKLVKKSTDTTLRERVKKLLVCIFCVHIIQYYYAYGYIVNLNFCYCIDGCSFKGRAIRYSWDLGFLP